MLKTKQKVFKKPLHYGVHHTNELINKTIKIRCLTGNKLQENKTPAFKTYIQQLPPHCPTVIQSKFSVPSDSLSLDGVGNIITLQIHQLQSLRW